MLKGLKQEISLRVDSISLDKVLNALCVFIIVLIFIEFYCLYNYICGSSFLKELKGLMQHHLDNVHTQIMNFKGRSHENLDESCGMG